MRNKMYNFFNFCVGLTFFIGVALVTPRSGEKRHGHFVDESSRHFEKTIGIEETETVSFAEMFLEQLFGRKINFKKLLSEYSSVCPIQQSCGVDYDGLVSFWDTFKIKAFSGCRDCTCDRDCVQGGYCCPGTHYGYLKHEFVNTILYPHDKESSSYMVDNCPITYTSNKTVIELCKYQMRPCYGLESMINFKNMFCAQCNYVQDCDPWSPVGMCMYDELSTTMFQSFSEVKSEVDKNDCIIRYDHSYRRYGVHWNNWDYQNQVRIDKCNVTGLWQMYDADLEWACENFHTPYNIFKNVFCYICNPSQAYSQNVPQIDKCGIFENAPYSFNALKEACEAFPVTKRAWPFKNKYCYACSEGQNMLKNSKTDAFSLSGVSEINDQHTLQTQLTFSLVFDTPNKLKPFVQENLREAFKYVTGNVEPHKSSKSFFNSSSIENIIDDYVTVCGAEHLCMDKVTSGEYGQKYGNPVCGECACTSTCAEMETCCPDIIVSQQPYSCLESKTFPSLSKLADSKSEWHGVQISGEKSYKIVDACLEKDHPFAHSCSSYDNNTDLLSNIPVGTASNVMYRNIYCYSCNNNKSDIILNIQAMCDTYIAHGLFTEVAELIRVVKLYCHRISFVPLNSRQCKHYDPVTASYAGGIKYNREKGFWSKERFEVVRQFVVGDREVNYDSVKSVYFSCNQTGYLEESNILVTEVCETQAINLLSLSEYKVGNTVYKNFACFLCNPDFMSTNIDLNSAISHCQPENTRERFEHDETLDSLCKMKENRRRWFPYKNMYCAECNLPRWQRVYVIVEVIRTYHFKTGYSHIFSLSPTVFERIQTVQRDPTMHSGRTYDFSLNQSRLLYCNEGYELSNTTCRPILQAVTDQTYFFSLHLIHAENIDIASYESYSNLSTPVIDLEEICEKLGEMLMTSFDHTTIVSILGSSCQAQNSCKTENRSSLTESEIETSSATGRVRLFADILNIQSIDLAAVIRIFHTESVTKDIRTLLNLRNKTIHLQDITNIRGSLQSVSLRSVQSDDFKWQATDDTCSVIQGEQLFDETFIHIDKFLLCPYLKFNTSEVRLQDNHSLILNTADTTFTKNEYKFIASHFIICVDDYNRVSRKPRLADELVVSSNETENILKIFTQTCTVISLVCLFLTFTVYCIFSSLRTVPGKNLMLLCMSLFCAQGLLQFGLHVTNKSVVCISIGIGIHYFWMAAFCAMHVCSFHMFKLFYFNELSNESLRNKRSLFIKYLFYCMFFPLALVLVTVFSNSVRTDSISAGYGENVCFISNFYIFVGTFLVPATLLFLNNIVFFILAFHSIRTSPSIPSNREKHNFVIFLRLCTIVGITWPLLILGNVVDTMWFSFVVASINALQGVYIFISFLLNKRVLSMCADRMTKQTGRSALGNAQQT